jgi:predicted O-methyltransferase YrrM
MLDPTFGNMTQAEADRLGAASVMPVDAVFAGAAMSDHQPGDTEPWVSRLVGDFVVATGARTVLETGGFRGSTSVYILDALRRLGGGHLTVCEIDPKRAGALAARLDMASTPGTTAVVQAIDVLSFLLQTSEKYDLAWVDDDHTKPHVTRELMALIPKMNPGGLILLHDVFGSTDLQEVVRHFGGYSIKLPRLGPAGGLGVIQVQ